ncbi:MAG: GNAT family N-acetyltransferase [Chromatiaceae bacterium]|jgi:GNAT superfamily N-acetyltransferase
MFHIRLMQISDLSAVVRLQDHCYADEFYESPQVVAKRLMLYPQSCWLACYQDKVWGYLFSYPSRLGQINVLGAEFGQYEQANCLYLHDMAVSPDARGNGVATALLQQALTYAGTLGLSYAALVAVQNSAAFWQQQQFTAVDELSEQASQALTSYGSNAIYLARPLN